MSEVEARAVIDGLLTEAGWVIQDIRKINLSAGKGIVVREFPTKSAQLITCCLSTAKLSVPSKPRKKGPLFPELPSKPRGESYVTVGRDGDGF
jgi:hypothetical protein